MSDGFSVVRVGTLRYNPAVASVRSELSWTRCGTTVANGIHGTITGLVTGSTCRA